VSHKTGAELAERDVLAGIASAEAVRRDVVVEPERVTSIE
jgi:hypothetical protein